MSLNLSVSKLSTTTLKTLGGLNVAVTNVQYGHSDQSTTTICSSKLRVFQHQSVIAGIKFFPS